MGKGDFHETVLVSRLDSANFGRAQPVAKAKHFVDWSGILIVVVVIAVIILISLPTWSETFRTTSGISSWVELLRNCFSGR